MDEPLQDLTVTANDYAGRKGFDETTSWASPTSATSAGAEAVLLPYTHFSALMRASISGWRPLPVWVLTAACLWTWTRRESLGSSIPGFPRGSRPGSGSMHPGPARTNLRSSPAPFSRLTAASSQERPPFTPGTSSPPFTLGNLPDARAVTVLFADIRHLLREACRRGHLPPRPTAGRGRFQPE